MDTTYVVITSVPPSVWGPLIGIEIVLMIAFILSSAITVRIRKDE